MSDLAGRCINKNAWTNDLALNRKMQNAKLKM